MTPESAASSTRLPATSALFASPIRAFICKTELPVKELVRPANQLRLAQADLAEDIACLLTAANPEAPSNVANYSLRERAYKLDSSVDHTLQHHCSHGWLVHVESEEAERLVAHHAEADTKDAGTEPEAASPSADPAHLRNQFNYSDRAAQTPVFTSRERGTMTEPPQSACAGGSCSDWAMRDAYAAHQARQALEGEQAKAKTAAARKGAASSAADEDGHAASGQPAQEPDDGLHLSPAIDRALHIVERMTQQNLHRDVIMDFKYWDDPADAIRVHEGTLLPLWRFEAKAGRGRHVTALAWSPKYADLLAAGYGSYNAAVQGTGAVACFTLKNPSAPEFLMTTRSGVMCLHFHPQHPNLLAVGLHDGCVLVIDIRQPSARPLYEASAAGGKHADAVAAVRWAPGEGSGLRSLAFYSVLTDGHIAHWTLAKSSLVRQDFMRLQSDRKEADAAEDLDQGLDYIGGTCLDFHKDQVHLLLVGSEDGWLHKCSKTYNSQFLASYQGHAGAVYAVHWNMCHPDSFLSASADWTVKLWHNNRSRAVITLDLGCSVGDAAWAPYSATVLAAAGEDGRLQVFDLAHNKAEPVSTQKIVGKAALTRMAFNSHHPIIVVGDDKGCIHCLKLSPNLRKTASTAGEHDFGAARLDAIVDVALKSDVVEPADTA
ncbi:WD40 repeat-like protein [Coccomyxa subellipsoidea C-169]|uniref:WD40 repeat-like protein n=1 Tax=Coccomyxa subellipsoidea (strain C-169) TaxID=574566 RepID=I0YNR3_COCSC|nr:WD40 repeat-like protein [Coccomyxa subellipsoidea C-169]EIE20032.1 WD40 repeat-like protein [Coccomyxa subellipsoidea C-169]|eukprot:XP_005644576.1 WD40 repeat-like protein [Coccomyxa subellipsoidea C-169]